MLLMLLMLNQGNGRQLPDGVRVSSSHLKIISCIIGGIGNQSRNYHPSDLPYLYPYLTSTSLLNYLHLHQMPNNIFESPQLNFANAYKLYPSGIFKQKFLTFYLDIKVGNN